MSDATIPVAIGGAIGGEIINLSSADLAAAFPGATKTPTNNFSLSYRGTTLDFYAGQAFVADAALLAAINAAGQSVI